MTSNCINNNKKNILIIHNLTESSFVELLDKSISLWILKEIYPNARIIYWPSYTLDQTFFNITDKVILINIKVDPILLNKWADEGLNIDVISNQEDIFNNINCDKYKFIIKPNYKEGISLLLWKYLINKPIPCFLSYINSSALEDSILPFQQQIIEGLKKEQISNISFDELKDLSLHDLIYKYVNKESFYVNKRNSLIVDREIFNEIDSINRPFFNKKEAQLEIINNASKFWKVRSIGKYKVPIIQLAPNEYPLSREICKTCFQQLSGGRKINSLTKLLPSSLVRSLYKHRLLQPIFVAVINDDCICEIYTNNLNNKVKSLAKKYNGEIYKNRAKFKLPYYLS